MKIFVPSFKRAGRVKTRKIVPDSIIVCHEFEKDDYHEKEGEPILVAPDGLKGNIAKVRNFILDQGEDEPRIVMMDDDLDEVGYHEEMKQHPMTPPEILAFLEMGYQMAEDLGVHLWGINLQADPQFYRQYTPVSFLQPILGTFSCHLRPDIQYDEGLFLNEDYDLFLKQINRNRKCLRLNKYYYKADHLDRSGGCASYRIKDFEIEQSKIMIRRWGNHVVKYNFKKSTNPVIYVPIGGV